MATELSSSANRNKSAEENNSKMTLDNEDVTNCPLSNEDDKDSNKENELKTDSDTTVSSTSPALIPQSTSESTNEEGSLNGFPSTSFDQSSYQQHQQQYVGMALKQWSVYLGNVLLNFIHKECKNETNSTTNVEDKSSNPPSTTVVPTGYCPCCHYHNQFANQNRNNVSALNHGMFDNNHFQMGQNQQTFFNSSDQQRYDYSSGNYSPFLAAAANFNNFQQRINNGYVST